MTIKDKLAAGSQVGFGMAPLGNMFRAIPHAEAAATVRATWGIRECTVLLTSSGTTRR